MLPQCLSPCLQMEKGGGGSWQQWCQLKDGMQNQQMGWQIALCAPPNFQQLLRLLLLSPFSGLSKASPSFSPPNPSQICSPRIWRENGIGQKGSRLTGGWQRWCFLTPPASACLDSSGILNEGAEQEDPLAPHGWSVLCAVPGPWTVLPWGCLLFHSPIKLYQISL